MCRVNGAVARVGKGLLISRLPGKRKRVAAVGVGAAGVGAVPAAAAAAAPAPAAAGVGVVFGETRQCSLSRSPSPLRLLSDP